MPIYIAYMRWQAGQLVFGICTSAPFHKSVRTIERIALRLTQVRCLCSENGALGINCTYTRKRYSVGLADSAHAVLLQVNDNTPVKLKIIFAI